MPAPRTLIEIALQSLAENINVTKSLAGIDERLALVLFELVLSKGKLTPRSLSRFQELVEEGERRREAERQQQQEEDEDEQQEGDLFSTARNSNAAAADNNDDDDNRTLYSSLAARIATLRIQLPPPVVPLGTGRWLGDLPPPWK